MKQKLVINRVFLLAFSIVAIPMSFVAVELFNATTTGNLYDIDDWISTFTILSNILVFIWVSFAFANIYLKNEKIESLIETWYIKNIVTLCILITGVVYTLLLFPYNISQKPDDWIKTITLYFGFSFAQHVLVPIFMVRDFGLTKGSNLSNQTNKDLAIKTLISTVVPLVWLFFSLLFIGLGVIEPQYFFMNVFETKDAEQAIYITLLVVFVIGWTGLFFGSLKWSNKPILQP